MDLEIQNFLTMFRIMACAGYEAHLNVSSEKKEIFVILSVNLGSLSSSSDQDSASFHRRRLPSYYRRQEKRKSKKVHNDEYISDGEHEVSSRPNDEHEQEMCCIHVHRPEIPPPDGKCYLHRCRPDWTREERAKRYGELELLSELQTQP